MEGTERTDDTLYTEWEPETTAAPRVRKGVAAAVAGGLALLAATGTWLYVRKSRKSAQLARRLPRFKKALKRAADHPDRVAKESPGALKKIATAAGSTVATMLAKRVADRAFAKYAHRRPATA